MQSKENVMKMFAMRLEGNSLEEIGQHFGITRERVRQILDGNIKFYGKPVKKCVFPGITNYLRKRGLSVRRFNDEMGFSCKDSLTLYNKLWGKTEFKLSEIKRILAFTGLTFEEAFGEEIQRDRKEDCHV